MNREIGIRRAEQKDLAPVFELASNLATSFVVAEPSFCVAFTQLLNEANAYLAIAELEGEVIGYVLAFNHVTFFANGRVAWVEELMVKEAHRKRGMGRKLMTSVEDWAASTGCKLIALATRRAAEFYRALGYQESATYFRKLSQE